MVTGTIIAAAVIGILGVLAGVFLGVASEEFKVEIGEKEILVHNELSGNNCGSCGYAGCDALARAVAASQVDVNAYPVSGASIAERIGAIMGVADGVTEKKVTFVGCRSSCDETAVQYSYYGVDDCKEIFAVPGAGEKACTYGYMGYGPCARACTFGAIRVTDGMTVVDKERCVVCGKYVASYPDHPVELVPYRAEHLVQYSSYDKGKDIKVVCVVGCIRCTLCTKQCKFDAIHMENNLAAIDYEKYTNYGKCTKKCPVKVIV